jgi:predicted amidophosphoribosyltransferase
MKGAFALTNATVNDAHIFLVDDVTTTGATLRDAAHTLKRISKNVTLVALARA